MRATCTARDSAWSCRCAGSSEPADDASLAFSIQLAETETPGVLQLNARGTASGSRSQLQVRLGRLPGLDSLPAAALTVRGAASFGTGAFGVHHTNPASGGLTLHSGEMVAIAGVSGNGQVALADVLCGLKPVTSGTVQLMGRPMPPSPAWLVAQPAAG